MASSSASVISAQAALFSLLLLHGAACLVAVHASFCAFSAGGFSNRSSDTTVRGGSEASSGASGCTAPSSAASSFSKPTFAAGSSASPTGAAGSAAESTPELWTASFSWLPSGDSSGGSSAAAASRNGCALSSTGTGSSSSASSCGPTVPGVSSDFSRAFRAFLSAFFAMSFATRSLASSSACAGAAAALMPAALTAAGASSAGRAGATAVEPVAGMFVAACGKLSSNSSKALPSAGKAVPQSTTPRHRCRLTMNPSKRPSFAQLDPPT
mmetsp:Transcript_24595/g.77864  ORF Transcript_24595/g.77864 Transcript_24595/m.77864 type:complete len:269 (+) Transcript_24595:589-1395(+)